jgi:hypothetical protein
MRFHAAPADPLPRARMRRETPFRRSTFGSGSRLILFPFHARPPRGRRGRASGGGDVRRA